MNSKKNKKNVSIVEVEQDTIPIQKKTKKKKTTIIGDNDIIQDNPKKRKNSDSEVELVPPKRSKKKKGNTDSSEPIENIENELSKHLKQKNGVVIKSNSEENIDLPVESSEILQETSKGKKKKVKTFEIIDDNNEDKLVGVGEGVSTIPTKIKGTNHLITLEGIDKKVLHHEVNIIDIKDAKVNEDNENVVTISIKDIDGLDSDWDENDLLKQLERRVEKKESPKERRTEWSDDDLKELVERMEVAIPDNDLKPYGRRLEMLEWDKIAFKHYTPEDCKKSWSLLVRKLRRHRILQEIIQDAKVWISAPKSKRRPTKIPRHPEMPRRPLSAYFIYYLKQKDSLQAEHQGMDATELAKYCSQKFKLLPAEKRAKYEKIAIKNKEEYEQKMKEFYEKYPELKVDKSKSKKAPKPPKPPKPVIEKPPKPLPKPKDKVPKRPLSAFLYYYQAEVSKEQVEDKAAFKELCKEKWKEMPDDKKIEWITFAEAETFKYEEDMKEYIKNHPEYVQTTQTKPQLTKEELLVKERLSGKPPKPPVSAYNLFARIILHSDSIKNIPVKERLVFVSNQWKYCTDEEKKQYKDLFDKTIEKYNKDYAVYLDTLSEEDRKLELLKNAPKRRKSEDESAKKESKPKKITKKKVETNTEKKKPDSNTEKKKPDSNTEKKKASKTTASQKKAEKKPRKLVEPEQPPISPFKYFASMYTGEEPVLKAWKALNSEEKKTYEEELVAKKKAYILDFEKFLKSMTKEELENFSNSRKKMNSKKAVEEEEDDDEDDDEDGSSNTSDSDENSNGSDDEDD